MCASQRKGDYAKWKWFDYCLYWGIYFLSDRESGSFSVFSGLGGVQMERKHIDEGYFATFVSASWREDVARKFMGKGKGMLIRIDGEFKNDDNIHCCDVSWLSKFPDEAEVLFARSWGGWVVGRFKCTVVDSALGVQTVRLGK
mgnify:CR=1 FL=1